MVLFNRIFVLKHKHTQILFSFEFTLSFSFIFPSVHHPLFLLLLRQFLISIVVERPDGREIAKPVELRVMVGDANDNRPTFPQAQYHTVVKELAARGK